VKNPKVNLTATVDTALKLYAIDSEMLAPGAVKNIPKGTELTAIKLGSRDRHYYLELEQPINGTRNWYAYIGHWDIDEALPEADPVISFNAKPVGKGKAINVPGSGLVYLGDAISSVSPNFFWYEATHDGSRIPQNQEATSNIIKMAIAAQKVRDRIGKPFKITSWYRPEPHNSRVGGARNSTHLSGGAMDILVDGMNGRAIAAAVGNWSGGMGIYRRFPNLLHLDVRGYRARWGGA